ncbi:S1 family peptidase [Chelatococcus asaccharovorans]|uniref:Trypsin-like peptidase n=1 Tax=Chelatococcus asaccharovorans TaxID=28210 RepID=A0A2V3ULH2_9HYPH|nr:serine protease [Chelatococcus asaccharovorans]MBS7705315.1 trypsin-like peptidase domain-containing protein [Chelatococcus asaccharovorans]PXW60282.1 trypsin-like peptidase [Chelatococcus asaccharovorans]
MIGQDILDRIVRIDAAGEIGTGLFLSFSGRGFILTARHVVAYVHKTQALDIAGRLWADKIPVVAKFQRESGADIALVEVKCEATWPSISFSIDPSKSFYTQDVFLFGFPHGAQIETRTQRGRELNPFCKKGIIAQLDGHQFYVDAPIAKGFSGGPVFSISSPSSSDGSNYNLIGVLTHDCPKECGFSSAYSSALVRELLEEALAS